MSKAKTRRKKKRKPLVTYFKKTSRIRSRQAKRRKR